MGFREAVTVCFQDYYTFSGRARRAEYWWFTLFCTAGSVILSIIDRGVFGEDMMLGLSGLFGLFVAIPQLAAGWRRMHDSGRSGWLYLIPLVAQIPLLVLREHGFMRAPGLAIGLGLLMLILTIVIIVWLASPSQPGPNRFGPEPFE